MRSDSSFDDKIMTKKLALLLYSSRAHDEWLIAPNADSEGGPGTPFFKKILDVYASKLSYEQSKGLLGGNIGCKNKNSSPTILYNSHA